MRKELQALKYIEPDMTDPDAPEITNWDNAVVGKFYRPRKQQVTIRVDLRVLDWFKKTSDQYQTLMNQALLEYMISHRKLQQKKKTRHAKKI